MSAAAARLDEFLERLPRPVAMAPPLATRSLVAAVLVAGPLYGAVMGAFALDKPERLKMVVYAAVKMPLLVFVTALVCLPAFFVLNTVLGLRRDFRAAFTAILAGQAALTIALASLAPLTAFIYASGATHRGALLFNAAMFTLATAAAHTVMLRRYRPLAARAAAHRLMLWTWVVLYAFVGVQMGWMLRPFVGNPAIPVTFFRQEPFSNAYIFIARLVFG
jgi:hypothetical protein